MSETGPPGARKAASGAAGGIPASRDSGPTVELANDWPWAPDPRDPPPKLAGDLQGAIDFGLAADEAELIELTAMICSGIPSDIDCTARWQREGTITCSVSIDTGEVKYHQAFKRTSHGLAVYQGFFWLPEGSRRRGFAKRTARNLVLAYDRLGIRQVDVDAGLVDGGIVWARLGARADDPDGERTRLIQKARRLAQQLSLDEDLADGIEDALNDVSDDDLLSRAVRIQLEDGTKFGEMLLSGTSWTGCWDLGDEVLRKYLRDVLK